MRRQAAADPTANRSVSCKSRAPAAAMLRAMDQRISLITLGYRDYQRAHDFYAAIGWTNAISPDDEVVFFQAGGMILALWDRAKLAED